MVIETKYLEGETTVVDDLEVTRIERENRNIYNNLSQLESEEKIIWGSKSEQVRQLARNYERLHIRGAYKEPISHICATIGRECLKRNLYASHWLANKVLDAKYKQVERTPYSVNPSLEGGAAAASPTEQLAQEQQEQEENFITTTRTVNPQEQSPFYFANPGPDGQMFPMYDEPNKDVQIDYFLKQTKSIDQMSVDELRETTEKTIAIERKVTEQQRELRRRKKDMLERCSQLKVPLSPDYEQDDTPHIGTKYGETGISVAWEAIEKYQNTLEKVQDKLYYFKPPMKMARKMAAALEEEIEFWRPMCDEKFRKDSMSWWVVQLDNIWFGKHAAAQMNATILDDRTKRALTREQVGDKSQECYQRALRFSNAQRWRVEFQLWYISQIEPKIGLRAKELHSTLSEKSFT